MTTSTNLDIAIDGTQAMTLLLNGIETLIPSQDPIAVNIRNQLDYDMEVVAHYVPNGNVVTEPEGSLLGTLSPNEDLIFGLKSAGINHDGSQGLILLTSTEAQSINGTDQYVVASFFCQHTWWGTKGTNGALLPIPTSLFQAWEKNWPAVAESLMSTYKKGHQTLAFRSTSNSVLQYSGEMTTVTSPAPANKTESKATFNMGEG